MIHALLDYGANINKCDLQGRTALYEAVSSSNAVPSSDVGSDETVLLRAATGNENHLVELLLKNGADLNIGDDSHKPLLAAVQTGDESLVKLLLDHGADLNAGTDKLSPLLAASQISNEDILTLLLEQGADPNANTDHLKSRYEAIVQRKVDIVDDLSQSEVVTGAKTAGTVSPLHIAAQLQDPAKLELLLRFGANVNSRDPSGRTPLFDTIGNQDFESTEILLDNGADLDSATLEDGRRPLHEAALVGNVRIFRLLLDSSLCVAPEDAHGKTPLDSAKYKGHDETVGLIESKKP